MYRFFFIIFAFLCSHGGNEHFLAEAAATIRVGDQLNSTSQLVSENGNFTLGFFTMDETKFSYFGIWYTYDDQVRKVWVANRDSPIVDMSAALTIDKTGQLIITSAGKTVANISYQGHAGNVSATLQNDGNFVLTDESDNQVLWQSFDNPTDTLLPGMKLGSNLTSGKNWTLNFWLSYQVPASGAFKLLWEPITYFSYKSIQLVIQRRDEIYWTSGRLILDKLTFEFMPRLNDPSNQHLNNLSFRDDAEARYMTYSAYNGKFPMWILNSRGEIQDGDSFATMSPTEFYLGSNLNNGCSTNSSLPVCRSRNDKFEEKNAEFIGTNSTYDDNPSLSLSDCMQMCWKDCRCFGFNNNSNGTGCIMYFDTEYIINDRPGAISRYVLVSSNTSEDSKAKGLSDLREYFLIIYCYIDNFLKSNVMSHNFSDPGILLHDLSTYICSGYMTCPLTWLVYCIFAGNQRVWIVIAVVIPVVLLILAFLCLFRIKKLRLQGELLFKFLLFMMFCIYQIC